MKIDNYIYKLIDIFKESMLPAIANEDDSVFETLRKAYIEAESVPIRFKSHQIFEATWIYAENFGHKMPNNTDYNKDFKNFFYALSEPWPIETFDSVGLDIRLIKKASSIMMCEYEIFRK